MKSFLCIALPYCPRIAQRGADFAYRASLRAGPGAQSILPGRRVEACGAGSARYVQSEVVHRDRAHAAHTHADRDVRRPRRDGWRREARLGPAGGDGELGRLRPVDPAARAVAVVDEDVRLDVRLVPGSHAISVAWRDRRGAGAVILGIDELAVATRPGADREVLGVAARMGVGRVRPAVRVRAAATERPASRGAARGLLEQGVLEQVGVCHVDRYARRRRCIAGTVDCTGRDRVEPIRHTRRVPADAIRRAPGRGHHLAIDEEIDMVDGDIVGGVGCQGDYATQQGVGAWSGDCDCGW